MEEMRYIAVIFWSIMLGQVADFIGGALNQQTYNTNYSIIVSIVFAIIFSVIPLILDSSVKESNNEKNA
ncbi:YjzD family protein [Companilactobacillus farciminis]|uniref:YjzD family protein n=1 Tax=Companilactobacillus farciminis TaxID=1612 RepID=UPI00191604FA|nr:YjzD family protein [Companilactobacillus farciminis]